MQKDLIRNIEPMDCNVHAVEKAGKKRIREIMLARWQIVNQSDSTAAFLRPDMSRSLSIVVPAHNEEKRLKATLEGIVTAAAILAHYEVIIVDDGSTDRTPGIADEWAATHPHSVVIHHPVNCGVGAAYRNALQIAHYPFLTLIPGDNAFESACLPALFSTVGRAEMIISYRANPAARAPVRRLLSIVCTTLLRIATGLPLRDGHSLYVWPVEKARKISVPHDYRYHLTSLCALVPEVSTYAEIPVLLTPMPDMFSRVLRPKVVFGLGWAMLRILARQSVKTRAHRPLKIELDDHGQIVAMARPIVSRR